MHPDRASVQVARSADDASPADVDRTAGVFVLVGSAITAVALMLPWGEKATLGFALTTLGREDPGILLAVVALLSASVAGTFLFRRPATPRVAMLLIGLAVAQLGATTWFGVMIMKEVHETNPHLVLISAIGTGVYTAGLGAVSTLAGATLAWTRRRLG